MARRLKPKDIDLLVALESRPIPSGESKKNMFAVSFPLSLLLIASMIFGYMGVLSFGFVSKLKEVEQYINDPQQVLLYEQIQEKQRVLGEYESALTIANDIGLIAGSYLSPKRPMFDRITAATSELGTIDAYQYDQVTSTLVLNCNAADYHNIPKFVRAVKSVGWFDDVVYLGYTDAAEAGFQFDLTCILKAVN